MLIYTKLNLKMLIFLNNYCVYTSDLKFVYIHCNEAAVTFVIDLVLILVCILLALPLQPT